MSEVVDVVISGAKKVASDVADFFTTPSGPFETIDRVVRDIRGTGRAAARTIGIAPGLKGQLFRQVGRIRPLEEVRRLVRRF